MVACRRCEVYDQPRGGFAHSSSDVSGLRHTCLVTGHLLALSIVRRGGPDVAAWRWLPRLKTVPLAMPLKRVPVGPVTLVGRTGDGAVGAGLEKMRRFALFIKTVFGTCWNPLTRPATAGGYAVAGHPLPQGGEGEPCLGCHSERSEESCSAYFQDSARFLVACGSSE